MTLCRVIHDKSNPYTIINNSIVNDDRVSYKAVGIWLFAFSRPADWQFYICDLAKRHNSGKKEIRSGLKELENAGYLVRKEVRDSKGRISYEWYFYETPQLKNEIKIISPQHPLRHAEKGTLLSTNLNKKNNKKEKPEGSLSRAKAPPSSGVVVSFEILDKLNISDARKKSLSKKNSEDHMIEAVRRVLTWTDRDSDGKALSWILNNWDEWEDKTLSSKEEKKQKQDDAAKQLIILINERKRQIESLKRDKPTHEFEIEIFENHIEINGKSIGYADNETEQLLKYWRSK